MSLLTTITSLSPRIEKMILSNMETTSSYDSPQVTELLKKPVVNLVRSHITKHTPNILQRPCYYIGSELDVEAPLFMGFTNIVLIDYVFANAEKVIQCVKRLEQYADPAIETGLIDPFVFNGTMKDTAVPISVTMIPKVFQDTEIAFDFNAPMYEPSVNERAGMLFTFMPYRAPWLTYESTWNMVADGGYVFSHVLPDVFLEKVKNLGFLREHHPEMAFAFIENQWDALAKRAHRLGGDTRFDGMLVQKPSSFRTN